MSLQSNSLASVGESSLDIVQNILSTLPIYALTITKVDLYVSALAVV